MSPKLQGPTAAGADQRHLRIAIVGAGFGGLGMAIRLRQNGEGNFAVFERASAVGGTWRDNTYPGCACDVESVLYSFSFAPNPHWSRMYSGQPEIQAYLRDCSERFGVTPHLRLDHDVTTAAWNEAQQRWHLATTHGEYTADILISAMGPLSEPKQPSLPGSERFRGQMFHSAKWDHSVDLQGQTVAVIGTGASAIQFVPQIQPQVAALKLFQRTPPWILPRLDRPFTETEHQRFHRYPALQKLWRLRAFGLREVYGLGFRYPRFIGKTRGMALRHMHRAIASPELRAALTPAYEIGCKRVLISNDYYPALACPNVEVVTTAIKELRESAVITADGREHPAGVIIYGTGFQVTDIPYARRLFGRLGQSLYDIWQGSPRAHLGTTVAGFPNLFLLLGPNTGLGHNSVILMVEAQIELVLTALRRLRGAAAATIEPKPQAQAKFNTQLDQMSQRTVWQTGGCRSWYLDHTGRNSTLWPASVPMFQYWSEKFHRRDYVLHPRHAPGVFQTMSKASQAAPADPKPLPEIQDLLSLMARQAAPALADGTVAEARQRFRRLAQLFAGVSAPVLTRELTITGDGSPPFGARLYTPALAAATPRPLLVYFHGGGFVLGDLETHDAACRRLCHDADVIVLAADYRCAPESPFPAAGLDAWSAYTWARVHAAALGGDARRIAVGGDSAGGNLAAGVCQRAVREGQFKPVLQLLIYPSLDRSRSYRSVATFGDGHFLTQRDIEWFYRHYNPNTVDAEDCALSPRNFPQLDALPPTLVVTAACDPLRDEGEAYVKALQAAGVVVHAWRVDGMIHGFVNFLGYGQAAAAAFAKVATQLRDALTTSEPKSSAEHAALTTTTIPGVSHGN